jgi:hypothetical protein
MRSGDLAGVYQAKTDEELLRLAMESDQLTSEAQVHLTNVVTTGRLSLYPGREHSDANRDPGNESCNTIGRTVYNAAEQELHRPLAVAKLPYTAASSAFSKVYS